MTVKSRVIYCICFRLSWLQSHNNVDLFWHTPSLFILHVSYHSQTTGVIAFLHPMKYNQATHLSRVISWCRGYDFKQSGLNIPLCCLPWIPQERIPDLRGHPHCSGPLWWPVDQLASSLNFPIWSLELPPEVTDRCFRQLLMTVIYRLGDFFCKSNWVWNLSEPSNRHLTLLWTCGASSTCVIICLQSSGGVPIWTRNRLLSVTTWTPYHPPTCSWQHTNSLFQHGTISCPYSCLNGKGTLRLYYT